MLLLLLFADPTKSSPVDYSKKWCGSIVLNAYNAKDAKIEYRFLMNHAPTPKGEITEILKALSNVDKAAMDRLAPLIYEELRRQAHLNLRKKRKHLTLPITALVHEAISPSTVIREWKMERSWSEAELESGATA